MKPLLIASCLLLSACAVPQKSELVNIITDFDQWIGQTKEARMKAIGIPDRCLKLSSMEELCEWHQRAAGLVYMDAGRPLEDHVTFTYDRQNIATAWSYSGSLGDFNSANYRDSEYWNTNRHGLPCNWPLSGCSPEDEQPPSRIPR